MGNNEKSKASAKSDESNSTAVPDQTSVHVYPDWAAMQAYYGHRVPLPPYYNTAMVPGNVPHPYMWSPLQVQHMMPPYGGPYAAMYPHGGVYAHPTAPAASGGPHGIQSPAPGEAVAQNTEAPAKSSGNADKGLVNKLKGSDGLVMSIGYVGEHAGDVDQGISQSSETGGTTDGSNGCTVEGQKAQTKRRRNHEGTPITGSGGKNEPASAGPLTDTDSDSSKVHPSTTGPVGVAGKLLGATISSSMCTALENSRSLNTSANMGITGQHPGTSVPAESWMQNEQELKRERRKQSNRESARRSRLRKQAEAEELAMKVDSLSAENVTLKSELNSIAEKSKQLKLENTILLDKLHHAKVEKKKVSLDKMDEKLVQAITTENLLARVNNTCPANQNHEEEDDYRNKKASRKLHQLLDRKPRSDAVVAS